MKKEDAIEILEAMAMAESTFSDEESKKCCEAIELAVEELKRETWFSVEERLPKPDSGPYWVAKKKDYGQWQMKMALFCDYGYAMTIDAKTDVTWRDFDYTKIVNVSHWMPLPEPPGEMETRLRG